jgi:nitrate/nitrite-specific signal transduction histidine kinase
MTLPLTVDVTDERFPPAVEATAYFVISEALTNAVKHSQAGSAHVSARAESGQLRVEVTDDGIGRARVSGTNGLAGLEDRCSALGGRLALDSRSGSGTRVSAVPAFDHPSSREDTSASDRDLIAAADERRASRWPSASLALSPSEWHTAPLCLRV